MQHAANIHHGKNVIYGSLPLILPFETPDQEDAFLKSMFEATHTNDLANRNNVRNQEELEELLNILSMIRRFFSGCGAVPAWHDGPRATALYRGGEDGV